MPAHRGCRLFFHASAWVAYALISVAAAGAGNRIIPEFSISLDDARQMTATLPAELRVGIMARPDKFLRLMAQVLDQPPYLFVLVDKLHALSPDYVPPDLVALKDYPVRTSWPHLMLRKAIIPAVLEMVGAAKKEVMK